MLQDKVENVARMSASHEELRLELGKYKKVSEWKEDREVQSLLNVYRININILASSRLLWYILF